MAGDFQQRELSGSLFKNTRKEHANQPDYRGDCLIDGVEYWVSGWIKETRSRDKFLSVAFTAKDGGFSKPDKPQPAQRTKPQFDDLGDDIPFSQGEHGTH